MAETQETITYEQAQKYAEIVTKYMVDNKVKNCLCCAESMGLVARTLSIQTVDALRKILVKVHTIQVNDVVPAEFVGELKLNRVQYNNLNVLKKHGLIAKLKASTDKRIRYCITRKGFDFITGRIEIPRTVWSFRNKTVRKSEEMIKVGDIMAEPPVDIRDSLFFDPPTENEADKALIFHKVKKKKRKHPCPNCEDGVIRKEPITRIEGNTAIILGHTEICNRCGWTHEVRSGY